MLSKPLARILIWSIVFRINSLQSELSDAKNEISSKVDEQKREESLRTRLEVELNQVGEVNIYYFTLNHFLS